MKVKFGVCVLGGNYEFGLGRVDFDVLAENIIEILAWPQEIQI